MTLNWLFQIEEKEEWVKLEFQSFSQVCHTISISLTLILAVWRYIAVAMPQRNREWCNYKRTILAIVLAYVFCPVLCIPVYFTTKVTEQVETINETLIGEYTVCSCCDFYTSHGFCDFPKQCPIFITDAFTVL